MSPGDLPALVQIVIILFIGGCIVIALDYWASTQTRIRIRGRILTAKKILAIIIMLIAMCVIFRALGLWTFLDNQRQSLGANAAEVFLFADFIFSARPPLPAAP
jgi:hypothetical protein